MTHKPNLKPFREHKSKLNKNWTSLDTGAGKNQNIYEKLIMDLMSTSIAQ